MTYWEKDLETYYHYIAGGVEGVVDEEEMDYDDAEEEYNVFCFYFDWEDDLVN